MRTEFLGSLKSITGKASISLEFDNPVSVNEFIARLLEEFPDSLKEALIDAELKDPRPNVLILVNGAEISALKGLNTKVQDGDKLVLIPTSHGG